MLRDGVGYRHRRECGRQKVAPVRNVVATAETHVQRRTRALQDLHHRRGEETTQRGSPASDDIGREPSSLT
jgi:hypothetical protein